MSREKKFSPGPWSHSPTDEAKMRFSASGWGRAVLVHADQEYDVAYVPVLFGDRDRAFGNAQLIAKAPELYALCEEALRIAETSHETPDFINRLRAALSLSPVTAEGAVK